MPLESSDTLPYWQCVPIARSLSGIQIRGDAHTWWGQAEGHYGRGNEPKQGAVLAFIPHGGMRLGHVAAVSKIVDDRTILVTHSNWSPINGRRGQIERDVKVIDVSEAGDWSAVRVWFAPSQNLGATAWPVHGFIYPAGKAPMTLPQQQSEAPAKLHYTAVIETERAPEKARDVKPTGRLAYLGKMLPKLNKL
ncbi:MAG: CHAP domain-containing protein [Chakrabartia sp.]